MKKNHFIIFTVLMLALGSCTYQKTNTIDQKDVNAGNEYVYGVSPDSAARQLSVTYEAKPELEKRTAAIREQLYGAAEAPAAAPADTTKKGA